MKALEQRSFGSALSAKRVALLGILVAIELVLARFTVGSDTIKVAFTFVVIALIGQWFGPYWGIGTAVVVDTANSFIAGYTWYYGFVISAVLTAAIYGFGFYQRREISVVRVIVVSLINALLVNLVLNTLWLVQMGYVPLNESAISKFIGARAIKESITTPIQMIVLYFFLNNKSLYAAYQRFVKG